MKNQMKFFFPILMIVAILSCNESVNKKVSIDFIKTFEGKINGKYPIIAKIQSNGGEISGNYYYIKIGEEFELIGTINYENKIAIKEFDGKGKPTGVFNGVLINENKIEGTWNKPNGKKEMSFFLIESNTNYESAKKSKKVIENLKPTTVKVLYRQEQYDDELKTNLPVLKINKDFLATADDGIRAIVGYYSARGGTDCKWENDKPNSDLSNLNCKLTKALNLGFQCSKSQKSFLKKWFLEEKEILSDIEGCYNVPETATSQSTYDYLNLEINGNEIAVKYKTSGVNLSTESFWETEGVDKYRIEENKIRLISREK